MQSSMLNTQCLLSYTAYSQPSFVRSAIDDQFYRHAWRLHVNLPLDSPMDGYSGVFSREADLTRLAGLARVVSLQKPSPWAGQPLRPDAHLEAACPAVDGSDYWAHPQNSHRSCSFPVKVAS
jgi:hypothetical protein